MNQIIAPILILIYAASASALDCNVVMRKPDGVKRFYSYVISSMEEFHNTGSFDTLKWLRAWRKEQARDVDSVEILKGCLARESSVRAVACKKSLDQVSFDLYVMNQDLGDAQVCEFNKLAPSDRELLSIMLNRSKEFHVRLLQSFHDLDWKRAMQRSETGE